ncbi:hypothetical protein E2C01_035276 [Portunus trituberculatus]|uniref:Uncharacterized protein n=1 Tax=Portunus trituberculatus TaxID=210409 RepID=A0A5B7F8S8_PORTR|nr:hypothetical protein [Portunus trituberculatus]
MDDKQQPGYFSVQQQPHHSLAAEGKTRDLSRCIKTRVPGRRVCWGEVATNCMIFSLRSFN